MDNEFWDELQRRGASLTEDQIAKFQLRWKQSWTDAVRILAPRYGIHANELLRKAPNLPVNPFDPGQLRAYMAEVKLKVDEELSEAEGTVCMLAFRIVAEVIWDSIKNRFPHLPELREDNK